MKITRTRFQNISVRDLTTREYFDLEAKRKENQEDRAFCLGVWVFYAACDESGGRIYSSVDDVIDQVSIKDIQDLVKECMAVSGFGEEVEAEAEKNLETMG